MKLVRAEAADLPAIAEFFAGLDLVFPDANLEQFVLPRTGSGGHSVTTLLWPDERQRIRGLLGRLEMPVVVGDGRSRCRWPVNFFLAPEFRGRGLGQELMRQVMRGATEESSVGLVLGGNQHSIPVLERTGWRRLGELTTFRWRRRPPHDVQLRVVAGLPLHAPWADTPWTGTAWTGAASPRSGVPRSVAGLRSTFGGSLAPFHAPHHLLLDDEPVGYCVLSARRRDGETRVEITDFDAIEGFETEVLTAALAAGFGLGSEVVAHACCRRFLSALAALDPEQVGAGLPLWILGEQVPPCVDDWHVTHGDHDRYRRWPDSLCLCPGEGR